MSCSGADDEVRDVVERLEAQPDLQVWTYRMGGLPLGSHIGTACEKQVARSEAFLVILTRAALGSAYVSQEVAAALASGSRQIWTIVDSALASERAAREWPDPFRRLASYRYATVDFRKLEEIEAVVAAVCAEFRIDHVPPPPKDTDFPFLEKLYDELRGQHAIRHEYEHAAYSALVRTGEGFQGAFRRKEYERAAALLDLLLAMYRAEFPNAAPYYAVIARALCATALGQYDRALQYLDDCMLACSQFPNPNRPNETLYSALGVIYYQLGMFDRAATSFRRALAFNSSDTADHCYLLLSRMQANEPVALDHELKRIDGMTVRPADRAEVDRCKATAYRLAGRLREALQLIRPMLERSPSDPEVCLECAAVLEAMGRGSDAEAVIAACPAKDNLLLEGRRLMVRAVRATRAELEREADAFLKRHPHNRHAAFIVLTTYRQVGLTAHARRLAVLVLDGSRFGVPTSRFDFLMCAEANGVLGREERARYDLERAAQLLESATTQGHG